MKMITVNEAINLVSRDGAPAISIYVGTDVNDRGFSSKIGTNLQGLSKTAESMVARTYDAKTKERLLPNLYKIAKAAARGQVQSLLIAADRNVWGHLNRETGLIQVLNQRTDATADDLLDDIAEMILLKGGLVTVLPDNEMPENQPIGAVFRWNDSLPLLNRQMFGIARPPRRQSRMELSA